MWSGEKIVGIINSEQHSQIDAAYIYDLDIFCKKCKSVKKAFPQYNLLYSMKANPHPQILQNALRMNLGIDAASKNEVELAANCGFPREQIYYSAPGKSEMDLLTCFDKCIIIADSINEVKRIAKLAMKRSCHITIGIRLNIPNIHLGDNAFEIMSGVSTKFGITLNQISYLKKICQESLIDIGGLHVYFGSQILDENVIQENFLKIINCAREIRKYFKLKFINFGGGFGVPYNEYEKPIDLHNIMNTSLSGAINEMVKEGVQCNLELGRYLIAEAGIFVTKVVDIKVSGGIKYIILSAGMNSFFRPVFTKEFHKLKKCLSSTEKQEKVTVVGNLCTPLDQYYSDYMIEKLKIDDWVWFENAGAYGYSMSLLDFISHDKPLQLVI